MDSAAGEVVGELAADPVVTGDELAADEREEDEEETAVALLDAAADFIGLVRDNDVETLRSGVERFGDDRARVVCCTVETRLGGLTAFSLAAELGHQEVIALFIELGADVNSRNATGGWTPLHCAVSQGFMKVYNLICLTRVLSTPP